MIGSKHENQQPRPATGYRLCLAIICLALAPMTAIASPVVPLQGVTLVSQGDFDRGCANYASPVDCDRGCGFVGERLYCWGDNVSGLLGTGAPSLTSLAEWIRRPDSSSGDFDRPTSLAVTDRSCVVDAAGVWCWGPNPYGQLGVGDRIARMQPTRVPGLPEGMLQVAHGLSQSCARSRSDGIWCWGLLVTGEQLDARRVPGLPGETDSIALGHRHACALADGSVWCWGAGSFGQLGDGSGAVQPTPVAVSGLPAGVIAIDAGDFHTCALMENGDAWCWGSNSQGQIGVELPAGQSQAVLLPQRVAGLPGVATALELASGQSCVLVEGRRWCWGANDEGRNGHATPRLEPRIWGEPQDWLGGCYEGNGALHCRTLSKRYPFRDWDARELQLQNGEPVQLALGRAQACARYADGAVWCWGGTEAWSAAPVRVSIPPASMIAVGVAHACAATDDGIWCWGNNLDGALGDGTTEWRGDPVRSQFSGTLVAAGDQHTCAWGAQDGLHCWGLNANGQSSGTPTTDPLPGGAMPLGNAEVVDLALGMHHSCATVARVGGVRETRCWGQLPLRLEDLTAGVTDTSPRLVSPGSPLPGEVEPRLRSSGFTTCLGERCYGLDFTPPQRGENRVGAILQPPFGGLTRAFALGARMQCAQGNGTDIRCAAATGRACGYEILAGLISASGETVCNLQEQALTALERDWIAVVGLPSAPKHLSAGEQFACAIADHRVWCWGPKAPHNLRPLVLEPVYRAGAIEPAPRVAVALDPARACPAYLASSVSLLDPNDASAAGNWGLYLLLGSGSQYLHGGINFGGFGSSTGAGVPGYAAFSIQNPHGPDQRVSLDLSGDGGEFVLTVESTLPPSTERTLVLREQLTLGEVAQRRNLTLANGFHIVGLQPLQGTRLFLAAVGTTQANGDAAAFLGGAVVGGWLDGLHSGFAGICTSDADSVLLHTQARSTLGAAGAGDLRLQVFEVQTGVELYDSGGIRAP